ncbi:vWA domain-containing protein [Sediminicoccus rosea]|uniref:VWA domain-containing protein n=1 Tax=Sediminicoccus rosea TaxID=1225128 RepID=A0ABZ0PE11_9PROT|nr:VWA domain-containing protein [Sediminicoccus rosea]WPB83944.1 VWA domain-containing protein [Sediminicoccus rosea]
MRLLLSLAVALAGLVAPPARAQPAPPQGETIVILDMSASMWGRIGDQPKLEIAREAVRGMFARFPAGSRVGLMAYGHRRAGQCSDIQMLFLPGPVDVAAAGAALDRLTARGRTPLTDSVRQAAAALRVAERGGTIILVTDGIETCGGDPCALAAELEAANAGFTAHVIGFDLRTPSERARVACIAERTGGLFVPAANPEELADALTRATEARPAPPPAAAPPRGIGLRATQGPGGPTLGDATFTVLREGEETPLHEGGALRLPLPPGRYVVTASTAERIGSVTAQITATPPDEIVVPLADALPRATVTPAQPSAAATGTVGVAWTGPNEPGDYLVIVPTGQGQEEPETRHYAWTRVGSPATLRLPAAAGAYEVRYILARAARPIGRAPLTVTPVTATLEAAADAPAGSEVLVRWTGPRAPGSWVGIVPAGAAPGAYVSGGFVYVEDAANPLPLTAPAAPGAYEIRFVEGVDGTPLAARPIAVTAAAATLVGPDGGMAGSPVAIRFTPDRAPQGSFIAITAPDAEASAYVQGSWAYADGGEVTIQLPPAAGTYELRYVLVAPGDAEVVARRPITATPPMATLDAPGAVAAGARVTVRFSGPRGIGDYVAIVSPDAPGDQYLDYFSVSAEASEGELPMPATAGIYQLRYVMASAEPEKAVIARRPIVVR